MGELIKITEHEGRSAVSARELYSFLEIGRDFTTWCRQMFDYGFEEERDFTPVMGKSTGGRPKHDFALTLECAKEIAMIQKNDKGKEARKYFIECEKRLREAVAPLSTLDMLELGLKQMREQSKRIDLIEREVAELKINTTPQNDYFTVSGYASLNKIPLGLRLASKMGTKAKKICIEKGYNIEQIPDPRFGKVNMYPKIVLEQVFEKEIA